MRRIDCMIALACILLLTGCKTATKIVEVPVRETVTVTDTLMEVKLVEDSVLLEALFYCDSLNIVRLNELHELKTKGVNSKFMFEAQKLTYRLTTDRDPVFIPRKTIDRRVEVPIYIDVPGPIEYRLHWYQRWLMWIGVVASISLAVWLLLKLRLR